jgi:hypothetical protein
MPFIERDIPWVGGFKIGWRVVMITRDQGVPQQRRAVPLILVKWIDTQK